MIYWMGARGFLPRALLAAAASQLAISVPLARLRAGKSMVRDSDKVSINVDNLMLVN